MSNSRSIPSGLYIYIDCDEPGCRAHEDVTEGPDCPPGWLVIAGKAYCPRHHEGPH